MEVKFYVDNKKPQLIIHVANILFSVEDLSLIFYHA